MSTDWSFDPQTGELHNEPPRNVSEYTVSELSFALKRTLEELMVMSGCAGRSAA